MEKSLQKTLTEKNIAEALTDEKVREILRTELMIENDPRSLLKKFKKETLPVYLAKASTSKMSKSELEDFSNMANKAMIALGPDTHLPLALALREKYQPLVLELVRRLKEEYNCQSVSEVMLAEVVAVSHARALDLSSGLAGLCNIEFLSQEKNGYYGLIAKEIDRAHRRMIHALSILRQMKQPLMEVNIKTKNAFIAQNQQINSAGSENPPISTNNENNDLK